MPMRLNVGASKKVTDNNYGSKGASINLELEVDSTLVAEPAKLQERVRQLFGIIRTSLAEELNGGGGSGNGHGTAPKPASTPASLATRTNGNNSTPRPATQSQIKAILAIARSRRLDIGRLLKDRFHVEKPEDLSIKQASELIDSLNAERRNA